MNASNTAAPAGARRTLTNFGGNRTWEPTWYQPASEPEILEILRRHANGAVRAIGALHSWSDAPVGTDAALDMSRFDEVTPIKEGDQTFVRVGAGCTLGALLDRLHANSDRTLPTIGVITRQTVSGIVSTATHGSGAPSLSHFVTRIRVAAYTASGEPHIYEYRDGEELRAARCALGLMGVILSMELKTVPKYAVEETLRHFDAVQQPLGLYKEYPLTQFALTPHGWTFITWQRRVAPAVASPGLQAQLFRGYNLIGTDVGFHVMLKTAIRLGPGAVRGLLKALPHLQVANLPRVDDAQHVLTMQHQLFQHEEMEVFVPESHVPEAAALLRHAIEVFGGVESMLPAALQQKLHDAGLDEALRAGRSSYVHHYPVLFRRVLPDDALISMTSSVSEPYFSMSLFTYYPPGERNAFYQFCSWIARSMHALYGARLHWGKHFPLGATEMARVHPGLSAFRGICNRTDPNGVFENPFTLRVLGEPPVPATRT